VSVCYLQDLEVQLHHLATGGGPKSLALESELRQQKSLCARLESDLTTRSSTVGRGSCVSYVCAC